MDRIPSLESMPAPGRHAAMVGRDSIFRSFAMLQMMCPCFAVLWPESLSPGESFSRMRPA
jgi:hypothetical protein